MKKMIESLIYIFLNYIVAFIPCWHIRKVFYRLFGMKIGNNVRIYMKCMVRAPWRISIGRNSVINEGCYLDGRGSLKIGENTSVSMFSMIISATHDKSSKDFDYVKNPVVIKDRVWIGAKAIVLDNSIIEDECIISAGSTFKGKTQKGYIYAGVPAKSIKKRGLEGNYELLFKDYFR